MADLADGGYLSQPHALLCRPHSRPKRRFAFTWRRCNRGAYSRANRNGCATRSARWIRSARALSDRAITADGNERTNVGIAAAIQTLAQRIDQIELVPLSDNRVLMILATRDRMVRNRVVTLDEAASTDELASIRNYVNRNFAGWQLGAARRELLRPHARRSANCTGLLSSCKDAVPQGIAREDDTSPEVHMEGASESGGIDLHLTRESLRDLLRALEEERRMIEILDRFLGSSRRENWRCMWVWKRRIGDERPGADRHDRAAGEPAKVACSAPCVCTIEARHPGGGVRNQPRARERGNFNRWQLAARFRRHLLI